MKKCILLVALFFFFKGQAFALAPKTHYDLNERISMNNLKMNSYLRDNLKMSLDDNFDGQSLLESIKSGGITEDTDPIRYSRSFNHFHDPLSPNWILAGFNWVVPPVMNMPQYYVVTYNGRHYHNSSAVWAQKPSQSSLLGNYSWPDARQYFYYALTPESDYQRNYNSANTFRALGQLMHLVQDASVPAHVRNDFHAYPMYEDWLECRMNYKNWRLS